MKHAHETTVAQRGLADTISGHSKAAVRAAKLRQEGSADVTQELEEIGLSAKTGWYASILLYGVGGAVTVLFGLLRPELVPIGVTILGIFALALAFACVFGAKYLTNADWATHLRLTCGLGIFLVGAVVAGPLRQAFVMLPLFVLITPTFLYGARFAVPYVTVVPAFAFAILLATPGHARTAHAIITVGAMLMIVISFMIAEQRTRALARRNRKLAYTDALTGIANMRRLRERLTEALGKPFGDGQPFALFAIDLDNFKLVNDTFDHSTGDRVLIAVAEGLDAEIESADLVARRGGDEFSVLVAHPADRDLDALAVRLSDAIEAARLATCPQITPSGSVAYVKSGKDDTIASVLQRADDKLHETKSAFHAEHGSREDVDIKVMLRDVNAGMSPPVDRRAAYRSVSAAVSRAYKPRSSSFTATRKRIAEDFRSELATLDPVWAFVTMMMAPITIVMLILVCTRLLAPLPLGIGLTISAGCIALTGFSLFAARSGLSKRWTHLVFVGAVLLTTLNMAFSGAAGTAVIDTYTILVLYAFYFMQTKFAALYLFACSALYAGFAVGAHYPYGGIRAGITVSVMFVAAGMVSKVRQLTLRFLRTNRELSEIDALTGVANLRALRARVDAIVEGAQHSEKRPVIVTVDLDKFKAVNDTYNHTVGDQVLESVARAVSEVVRVDELVARRGGDEFFILFGDANEEHIEAVLLRVREAVRHARLRLCPDLIPTASVGFVTWQRGQNSEAFMHTADLAMHDEKIEARANDYEQERASA
jgi:diguanylate cyclase (GGDEF)-like protein